MPLYNVQIWGRVQGVSYRFATKVQAEKLGVKGIVRNEADGTVYAEIEGEDAALQAMISWCRQGPPSAWVEAIAVAAAPEKHYRTFDIIR